MSITTKNGLPWTSLIKFDTKVEPLYLERLNKLFNEIDWGQKYENYKRPKSQSSIYPSTRRVLWTPEVNQLGSVEFENLVLSISQDVKKLFPIDVTLTFAEITLLVPNGFIPWHYDGLEVCRNSTRIMLPFTLNENIKYYFCSWHKDTPVNKFGVDAVNYIDADLYELEMNYGSYYLFNHRIPHKTISRSNKARGLLALDMIATELKDTDRTILTPITEFEKAKILPPINC